MNAQERMMDGIGAAAWRRGVAWRTGLCAARLALIIALAILTVGAAGKTEVRMKEVPIPDSQFNLPSWEQACGGKPSAEVKRYPKFKSAKPLYGEFFVKESDRKDKPGAGYFFAIDESGGTGTGYNRFYIDANHNLDLTDDKPVKSHKGAAGGNALAQAFFAAITIPGVREDGGNLALVPRITRWANAEPSLYLAPGLLRRGYVTIGGLKYTVTLTHAERASARYDLPSTPALIVLPETGIKALMEPDDYREMNSGELSTMFLVNDTWVSFSTTASGDKLTVQPYEGDMGAICVSHGGATRGNRIFCATLKSRSGATLRMNGGFFKNVPDDRVLRLPVGDYAPASLDMEIGPLAIEARRRCAPDEQDQYAESDYFLKISKSEPYVLNIDSSAEIIFQRRKAEPAYKPGDYAMVGFDLATPTLFITYIMDRTVRSIQPKIAIHDSTGKTVSGGAFGGRYSWSIPPDFVPRNGREVLKATVTWDTKGLFGVVTGTEELVVESTQSGVK